DPVRNEPEASANLLLHKRSGQEKIEACQVLRIFDRFLEVGNIGAQTMRVSVSSALIRNKYDEAHGPLPSLVAISCHIVTNNDNVRRGSAPLRQNSGDCSVRAPRAPKVRLVPTRLLRQTSRADSPA